MVSMSVFPFLLRVFGNACLVIIVLLVFLFLLGVFVGLRGGCFFALRVVLLGFYASFFGSFMAVS